MWKMQRIFGWHAALTEPYEILGAGKAKAREETPERFGGNREKTRLLRLPMNTTLAILSTSAMINVCPPLIQLEGRDYCSGGVTA